MNRIAFKQVHDCTDKMFDYLEKHKNIPSDMNVFTMAMIFYETTLQHPKFVSQRSHFKERLFKYNKAFYEGYFKIKTPTK